MVERIAHWLSASGASGTSSEAVSTGSEHKPESVIDQSSSQMVAVLPDLREISISAVLRLANEGVRMASSEQLSQAALIYEQVILARRYRPEASSEPQRWWTCAEEAARVEVMHYLEERLPTQEESPQSLQWQREHDRHTTDAQSEVLQWCRSARQAQLHTPACAHEPNGQEPCTGQASPRHASEQTTEPAGNQADAAAKCVAISGRDRPHAYGALPGPKGFTPTDGGSNHGGVRLTTRPTRQSEWLTANESLRTRDAETLEGATLERLLNEALDDFDSPHPILRAGSLNGSLKSASVIGSLDPLSTGATGNGAVLGALPQGRPPGQCLSGEGIAVGLPEALNCSVLTRGGELGDGIDNQTIGGALDGVNTNAQLHQMTIRGTFGSLRDSHGRRVWVAYNTQASVGSTRSGGGTLDGGTLDGGTLDGGTLDGGTLLSGTLDGGTLGNALDGSSLGSGALGEGATLSSTATLACSLLDGSSALGGGSLGSGGTLGGGTLGGSGTPDSCSVRCPRREGATLSSTGSSGMQCGARSLEPLGQASPSGEGNPACDLHLDRECCATESDREHFEQWVKSADFAAALPVISEATPPEHMRSVSQPQPMTPLAKLRSVQPKSDYPLEHPSRPVSIRYSPGPDCASRPLGTIGEHVVAADGAEIRAGDVLKVTGLVERNNLNGRNALILGYHPSKEGLYTLITGQTNFVLLRAQNLRSLEADGGSTELAKVKALMQVGNGANRVARALAQHKATKAVSGECVSRGQPAATISDAILLAVLYLAVPGTLRQRIETWVLRCMVGPLVRMLPALSG